MDDNRNMAAKIILFFKIIFCCSLLWFVISFLLVLVIIIFIGGQVVSEMPVRIFDGTSLHSCMITKMYQVRLCPGTSDYVPLKQISNGIKKAVLVSEDSAFYQHHGFDFAEIKKSYETNMIVGEYKRGGSTLTQQLAKNLFLSKEKTFQRKIVEAFYTVQLEKYLTKDEILERYLNVVQFGKDIFGVKAAAEYYFKKSPQVLTLNEGIFLAILLPNPVKYAQSFHKQKLSIFAGNRMKDVLLKLKTFNRITEEEYNMSFAELPTFFSNGMEVAPTPDSESLDEDSSSPSSDTENNDSI